MILCDIGNTTYHFKDDKKEFKIGVYEKLNLHLSNYKKIYFISVNKIATKKLLKEYPNSIDISSYIKLNSTYQGLGIDRKIVSSYVKNGIIVDSGSAITVDIVKNGKHKGGFILPGIDAYKKIYPDISNKLNFDFKDNTNINQIPLCTNDAINYAILNSIILPIKKVQEKYDLKIYFTGGNSKYLLKYFNDIEIRYKKNLIFKSMKKIINSINTN